MIRIFWGMEEAWETGSSMGVNMYLELPYHRAVQLGLFLVESEGLAEVLQAFKGGHGFQLTVIHLQGVCGVQAGEESRPGLS